MFLQIGSNDAKANYWESEQRFKENYVNSVKKILEMQSKPKLVLMTNTPVLSCVETIRPDIKMQRQIANEIVPKVIHEVASEFDLDLLDIYSLFGGGNNTKLV